MKFCFPKNKIITSKGLHILKNKYVFEKNIINNNHGHVLDVYNRWFPAHVHLYQVDLSLVIYNRGDLI